ncbi:MAG TPA: hypothetical protein VM513_01145 [Kofleriaceae bacterium]|jgi:hypothetical protein|nr:hypothetical protein [Kofleriaceae bacterium]
MQILRGLGCVTLATILWIGSLRVWFSPSMEALAEPLARRQLALWQPDAERELAASLDQLRRTNPEWDLMARMFAALAFANLALRDPGQRATYLATMDRIIDRTLADVARDGTHGFLLAYSRDRPFVDSAGTSIFIEGELALMLAARQLVERDPARVELARTWVQRATEHLERGPVLLAESYPDEVWLFCNTVALAAIRLHDVGEGAPDRHARLFARWVATAKATIADPRTGLLAAKTTLAGHVLEGPEGSTLWVAAVMLRMVDDDFARAQYAAARAALRGSFAGFGWAREWPATHLGRDDIDSGPTIPIVGANAGASGLALIAARAFDDDVFARELTRSLRLAAFPVHGGERYAAGNQLADAAVLYAAVSGPLWERAMSTDTREVAE